MLVIFFYSNNEQNISLLGDSIYKLRFQNVELVKEINALITDNRISVRPHEFDGETKKSINMERYFYERLKYRLF